MERAISNETSGHAAERVLIGDGREFRHVVADVRG
jgi:hypothetical protein